MATATPKPPDSTSVALSRLSDRALFGRAATDEAAFAELVHRYREPLRRHAARYVGDADAEDVVQQALVNASLAIRREPEREIEPKPWLYTVTTNAAIDHRRAQSVRPLGDRPHEEIDVDALGESAGSDPHEVATRRESVRSMVSGIRGLSPNQRRAATARFLEGRSHDEIADELGVSKGAARELIHRAKRNLREAIPALSPVPLFAKLKESLAALFAGSGSAGAAKLTAGAVAVVAVAGAGGVAIERAVGGENPAKPAGANEAAAPVAPASDGSPAAERSKKDGEGAGAPGDGNDGKGGSGNRAGNGGGEGAGSAAGAPPAGGGAAPAAPSSTGTPTATGTGSTGDPIQDVANQVPDVDQVTDQVNDAVNQASGAANDLGIGVDAPQLPDVGQALGGE